jgi:myosin V
MDFENTNVLHQLRCGGVLEAVRISCAGYPSKVFYEDFVDHFWNLAPELLSKEDCDDRAVSTAILAKTDLQVHLSVCSFRSRQALRLFACPLGPFHGWP